MSIAGSSFNNSVQFFVVNIVTDGLVAARIMIKAEAKQNNDFKNTINRMGKKRIIRSVKRISKKVKNIDAKAPRNKTI